MFSADCFTDRTGIGRARGATTRPREAEREAARAAGLAARKLTGETGAKAAADDTRSAAASSDRTIAIFPYDYSLTFSWDLYSEARDASAVKIFCFSPFGTLRFKLSVQTFDISGFL